MQNLPAGSTFGKLIKSFVSAPVGWLFGSADFKALEEMTNSLLTKDPNKLAVYAGHKQYEITVNGKIHRIKETDVVRYDGIELTGLELYEKLKSS